MIELKSCPFCGEKNLIDYCIMGGTHELFGGIESDRKRI